MIKNNSKYIINFTVFSIAIAFISVIVDLFLPSIEITDTWPFVLITLYLFTIISFCLQAGYINKKITSFANAFMLITFGRLILFAVIIVVYSILRHSDAILFAITFFVYYVLLSIYEITAIFRLQKRNKPYNH